MELPSPEVVKYIYLRELTTCEILQHIDVTAWKYIYTNAMELMQEEAYILNFFSLRT